jgi:hypothetical protein
VSWPWVLTTRLQSGILVLVKGGIMTVWTILTALVMAFDICFIAYLVAESGCEQDNVEVDLPDGY